MFGEDSLLPAERCTVYVCTRCPPRVVVTRFPPVKDTAKPVRRHLQISKTREYFGVPKLFLGTNSLSQSPPIDKCCDKCLGSKRL